MAFEQFRRQRRREGQRIDRRDHCGDGNCHGELLVELAGDAAQERHRHEHGTQHERDRDDRARDFLHRLVRRLERSTSLLDVAFDVLDHHDRVIHHDSDREHEAEQGQCIDRETEYVQRGECSDNGDRFFKASSDRYHGTVSRTLTHRGAVFAVYALLLLGTGLMFQAVPRGFIPTQDKLFLMAGVKLPEGASLERTDAVLRQVVAISKSVDGIAHVVAMTGLNPLQFTNTPNYGIAFLILTP